MNFLIAYLEHFTYIGLFSFLLLAGLGVPIPEEGTIITSGYLVYLHIIRYWIDIPVCVLGVLTGDCLIFGAGRRWGKDLARLRLFRGLLTEHRIQNIEWYFAKYGTKTIFAGRFLAGLRVTIHITAGAMKMPFSRFLLWDALSALVSVPLFVWLGFAFGPHIDLAIKYMRKGELGLITLFILGVAGLLFYRFLLKPKRNLTDG